MPEEWERAGAAAGQAAWELDSPGEDLAVVPWVYPSCAGELCSEEVSWELC